MSSDLVDFIRARLDEDEQAARDASSDFHGRFTPAHVLAEVAAKRAIVAEHDTAGWATGDRLHDCQWRERPCTTLRLLAAPYATHPDYREGWRP